MKRITPEPFPVGARVVFAGDSITFAHDHVARIAAHYKMREPRRGVRFWNAGIAGGTVSQLLEFFEEDIARVKPTHVPLMIGMNDSDRDALRLPPGDPKREERIESAFARYRVDLGVLLDRITALGALPILCTPTPYAEFSPFTNWGTLCGGHALILRYADEVRRVAAERGLPLVDFHATVCERYPAEKLFGDDRVHPTPVGHKLMANAFLESQGLEADEFETSEEAANAVGLSAWLVAWRHYRNLVTAHFLCFDAVARRLPLADRIAILRARLDGTAPEQTAPTGWFREIMEIYIADVARRGELAAKLDELGESLFA